MFAFAHLAYILSHLAVSQQHKILNKFMGVLTFLYINTGRSSALVELKLYFSTFKADGAIFKLAVA